MLVSRFFLSALIIVTFSYSTSAETKDKKIWRVKTENFSCFLKHLNTYKRSNEDPVIIYLDACPETDFSQVIKKLTKNSVVPSIDKSNTKKNEIKSVITYLKDELVCLEKYVIDKSKNFIDVPVKPCGK